MASAGRVLVVEDNALVRESYVDLLRQRGYDVAEAAHGEEALDRLYERTVDVALIDVMMPTMGGLELRQRLVERAPDVHTILVTGQPEKLETLVEDDPEFQYGSVAVLYKPVHPVKLLAAIEKGVSLAAQKRAK
ncbi:MAG: response regulator [Rhodospirillaceae bacterium]|nr:response regulator [Rhodospirillaceae bacterium]